MTKQANESFSAFLDGEATELDIQRMLKALDEQPEVLGQFHNLSKTHAALQGEPPVDVALTMVGKPSMQLDSNVSTGKFGVRLMQGSIAAVVSLMVIGVAAFIQPENQPLPVAEVSVVPHADQEMLAHQQAQAQQRLEFYLKEHAEQASFTSGHAVVPTDMPLADGLDQ